MDLTGNNNFNTLKNASRERVRSIDLARGIAIFLMVVIHVIEQFCAGTIKGSTFAHVIYATTSIFSAPVFVFLMGTSTSFSSKTTLRQGVTRGVKIFLLGYLLNLLRGVIPVYLSLITGHLTMEDMESITPLFLMKEIDILQFAGLAIIVTVCIKHLVKKPVIWLLLGAVVLFFTPMASKMTTEIRGLDYIFSLLWGTDKFVYFPLFPWLAYALFGMAFGFHLKKAGNKTKFYNVIALMGLIILTVGIIITIIMPPQFKIANLFNGKYLDGIIIPGLVVIISGIICLWLYICYHLVLLLPENPVFNRLYIWSKYVTGFYCVQWILLGWFSLDIWNAHMHGTIFYIIVFAFVTDRVVLIWQDLKLKFRDNIPIQRNA